jgi:regulator of replication initiation timing
MFIFVILAKQYSQPKKKLNRFLWRGGQRMKPDEIKAKLEFIGEYCDYDFNDISFDGVISEALEYIKQLESDLQLLRNDYEHSKSVVGETVKRNQRLREKLMKALSDLKTAKTKAIREFSERLKEKVDCDIHTSEGFYFMCIEAIDNLVKEMVGVENDG